MKTKIIGITGGIGSGKTKVIEFIKNLGYSVYIADEESKKILNNEKIINKLQFLFGKAVITEDNLVNRKALAELVFSNPENLQKLNSIVHPEVKEHFNNWVTKQKSQSIVFKEAAILFESGSYKDCDFTILITAPLEIRIDRVMKRDKITKNQVLERVKNQWTDEEKSKYANFVVENIDFNTTKSNILQIIDKID